MTERPYNQLIEQEIATLKDSREDLLAMYRAIQTGGAQAETDEEAADIIKWLHPLHQTILFNELDLVFLELKKRLGARFPYQRDDFMLEARRYEKDTWENRQKDLQPDEVILCVDEPALDYTFEGIDPFIRLENEGIIVDPLPKDLKIDASQIYSESPILENTEEEGLGGPPSFYVFTNKMRKGQNYFVRATTGPIRFDN